MYDLEAPVRVLVRWIGVLTLFFAAVYWFLPPTLNPSADRVSVSSLVVAIYIATVVPLGLWTLYLGTTPEGKVRLETGDPRPGRVIGGHFLVNLRSQPRAPLTLRFRVFTRVVDVEDKERNVTLARASVEVPGERIQHTADGTVAIPFQVAVPVPEEPYPRDRSLRVHVHVWSGVRILARGELTISPL